MVMIENTARPRPLGVVRWRIIDLFQCLWDEYGSVSGKQTLSRGLAGMGYRKLSARPRHHAQAADAVEAFKNRPATCRDAAAATEATIDEF